MTWTDGTSYIGEWCHGIQHGHGKMIMPDGTVKEGYFDCNVYKGPKSVASRGSMLSSNTQSTIERTRKEDRGLVTTSSFTKASQKGRGSNLI
jgi:MORN repeat